MGGTADKPTPLWMPLAEAVTYFGSLEALLSHQRASPIPARHHGLYRPSGESYDGPGDVGPKWWADTRIADGRLIFRKPGRYSMSFLDILPGGVLQWAADQPPPPPKDEVFALGLELVRELVEQLPPAPTSEAARFAMAEFDRMVAAGTINRDSKIGEIERIIARRMKAFFVQEGIPTDPWDPRTVGNRLREWKKWPLKPSR